MGNRIILKFLNDLKIIKFRYIDYYKNSFFIFIFIMKNNKEEVIEKRILILTDERDIENDEVIKKGKKKWINYIY